MFIPYRVDVPFNHRPVMNWLLIAGNIAVFVLQIQTNLSVNNLAIKKYALDGWNVTGLFGHMWLHAGFLHLFGNMLFLWLFGNAICSKIGNIFYIPIYLGLGSIAAASHLIFDGRSAIGASGAINGIVGMYLVFFPENSMSCMFWLFFRPYFFTISGLWMILLWFAFDIFGAMRGSGGVAYVAHIGGFLGGVGLAVLMLKTKLVTMERYEKSLLDMFKPKTRKTFKAQASHSVFGKQKPEKTEMEKAIPEIQPKVQNRPVENVIRFNCKCGQKIKVPRIYEGKAGRCPKCSMRLVIPSVQKCMNPDYNAFKDRL